jgi:hypothetical protein
VLGSKSGDARATIADASLSCRPHAPRPGVKNVPCPEWSPPLGALGGGGGGGGVGVGVGVAEVVLGTDEVLVVSIEVVDVLVVEVLVVEVLVVEVLVAEVLVVEVPVSEVLVVEVPVSEAPVTEVPVASTDELCVELLVSVVAESPVPESPVPESPVSVDASGVAFPVTLSVWCGFLWCFGFLNNWCPFLHGMGVDITESTRKMTTKKRIKAFEEMCFIFNCVNNNNNICSIYFFVRTETA